MSAKAVSSSASSASRASSIRYSESDVGNVCPRIDTNFHEWEREDEMKQMIAMLFVVFGYVGIASENFLSSITTNVMSEIGNVLPGVDTSKYNNDPLYVGYPDNIGVLAAGAITNGNFYFVYAYGVKSMQVSYDYTNEMGECYSVWTNHFICIQSNKAVVAVCSLLTDDEGYARYEGKLAIPDVLVGENGVAQVLWSYIGSAYNGTYLGPMLGEHSLDGLTSIIFPEGYSIPSCLDDVYWYYYSSILIGERAPGMMGFWNLQDLTFLGRPDCFAIGDYIPSLTSRTGHPIGMMLPFADQINISEKYAAQWLKILRNIGYGGNIHVIGSGVTNRLNQVVAGPVTMTTTNVVIHYVQNSAQSAAVSPVTSETGFVNVITEIKGGNVAVPDSWAANYPDFVSKLGDNFTAALMKPTKKKDGANNLMLVWQDYVAGTNPTKEDDVFKASITKDENGKIIISYTPEFKDEAEKAKRKYTTLGKKSLMDGAGWEVVPEGREADYNFFKVTVEMRRE